MEKLIKNLNLVFLSFMIMLFIGCKPEPVVLTSIEITSPAVQTEYFVGEDLDTTGLEVTAYYSDGTNTIVEGWTTEGFDSSASNDNLEVRVLFEEKETSFCVKIIEIELYSIEITKPATKTEYCINEPVDTTGIEVTAVMNKGREVVSGWTVEFDNTVVGNTIPVKISYFGKEAFYTVIISNHIWNEGEVTTVPTCVTKGVKTYKCSICQEVLGTEEIPELYCSPVDAETDLAATSVSTYVYFGVFPKTVLPSNSTVTVDETDSVTMGANTYYKGSDGNYYAKVKENAFRKYYEYSDDTKAKQSSENSYRYFKIEPIKWKVLTTDYNGKALLLAEDILTANVPYYNYNSYENTRTVGSDTNIYPSNYKYSQIRAYLNGLDYYYDESSTSTVKKTDYTGKGFLQTAFTATAQSKIAETVVDNSDASTIAAVGYIKKATTYACANTTDKIFLLSEKEVTTTAYDFAACDTYGAGNARIRFPTDYAKANYVFQTSTAGYGGHWWLRSPYYYKSYDARTVRNDGDADSYCTVSDTQHGLVPALSISF